MSVFYNYTSEPFTYTWGKIPYTFKPDSVYSGVIVSDHGDQPLVLNAVLSRFFAKHLAEHVLNSNKSVAENALKYNLTNMELLIERGMNPPSVEKPLPSFVDEIDLMNAGSVVGTEVKAAVEVVTSEAPKKRMGRPPKAKEVALASENVEFDI